MEEKKKQIRVAILGASGYSGRELIRLLLFHPRVIISHLTAERKAGQTVASVFPQFAAHVLPEFSSLESIYPIIKNIDLVFSALPHGKSQTLIPSLLEQNKSLKIIDLSADFRLQDPVAYVQWYQKEYVPNSLQQKFVYGLPELHRKTIRTTQFVSNPGCYPTSIIIPLAPLLKSKLILHDYIVVDSKSGASGAGNSLKEESLFVEAAEGIRAYSLGSHRHTAEIDQELQRAADKPISVSFTPHLAPYSRGILSTIYVRSKIKHGLTVAAVDLHQQLEVAYQKEPFVKILPFGKVPSTQAVRGSNQILIGVANDRMPDRAILVSAIDNLLKGAAGQAVQNMNLLFSYPETMGLDQIALT